MGNPFGRMSRFWEVVGQRGGEVALNRLRSPPGAVAAVAARGVDRAQQGDPLQNWPRLRRAIEVARENPTVDAAARGLGAAVDAARPALAAVGAGMSWMLEREKQLSAPFAAIPFPGLPALRVFDVAIGLPHAHNHPPNITPPNPVPIFLPSIGPVLPIPILSGASTTMINGTPAARCGDMGAGVWCGGFFPLFEVFLGSASVWIEGARAARVGVDITKHCIFSAPRPSDPPLGPMVGATVSGSFNVFIGGIPMPSLTSFAIGQAFKGLFRGLGAVWRRVTARSYVNRLLRSGRIRIEVPAHAPDFGDLVRRDLERMARTRSGRTLLRGVDRSGRNLRITFDSPNPPNAWGWGGGHPDAYWNAATNRPGAGADGVIGYDPLQWPNPTAPRTRSDHILAHEMNHARNGMLGRQTDHLPPPDAAWGQRWKNFEEYGTVHTENGYRYETGTIAPPQRTSYGALP